MRSESVLELRVLARGRGRLKADSGLALADLDLVARDAERFLTHNTAVYAAVAAVTGKSVLVDSSKSRLRLEAMLASDAFDVTPIHLVRDPRGVVRSNVAKGRSLVEYSRKYRRGARTGRAVFAGTGFGCHGGMMPPSTTIHWRTEMRAFAIALFLFVAPAAWAESVTYTATLDGKSEVPPNDSKGTGTVDAKYDTATMKLTWTVTYSGLSGPATAAHFHGPAKPGVNAGPAITLSQPLDSPIKGEATLTKAQADELAAAMWYLNVHTAGHPPGEIRGQLGKK